MATMATNDRDASQPTCQNCTTSTTPLWRRDEIGSVLCNACGLFLKLHGRARPISLKTDVIKSRNRVKSSSNGQGQKKKVCAILCPQHISSLTCLCRAFLKQMVSPTRAHNRARRLPAHSVIDEPLKSRRMVVDRMVRIHPSHVPAHRQCTKITCNLSTAIPCPITRSTPHHLPHFISALPRQVALSRR